MSLRAIHFVLETHERELAGRIAVETEARFLASAAKWDRKQSQNLERFLKRLEKISHPHRKQKTASKADLIQLFRALAIPETKPT